MTSDLDVPGLDTLAPPQDQAAVGATMGRLMQAFTTRDADAFEGVYAADADWVNAFGTVPADAVVFSVHLRILGQGLAGGGEIPMRDNFSLHVLERRADGGWAVVSEMYMDAREETAYAAGRPAT